MATALIPKPIHTVKKQYKCATKQLYMENIKMAKLWIVSLCVFLSGVHNCAHCKHYIMWCKEDRHNVNEIVKLENRNCLD